MCSSAQRLICEEFLEVLFHFTWAVLLMHNAQLSSNTIQERECHAVRCWHCGPGKRPKEKLTPIDLWEGGSKTHSEPLLFSRLSVCIFFPEHTDVHISIVRTVMDLSTYVAVRASSNALLQGGRWSRMCVCLTYCPFVRPVLYCVFSHHYVWGHWTVKFRYISCTTWMYNRWRLLTSILKI